MSTTEDLELTRALLDEAIELEKQCLMQKEINAEVKQEIVELQQKLFLKLWEQIVQHVQINKEDEPAFWTGFVKVINWYATHGPPKDDK